MNTKSYECDELNPNPHSNESLTCNYHFYNEETAITSDLVLSDGTITEYLTAEESGTSNMIRGTYGNYKGNGHFLVLGSGFNSNSFSSFENQLKEHFYLRSVADIIRLLSYNLDMNILLYFELVIADSFFHFLEFEKRE